VEGELGSFSDFPDELQSLAIEGLIKAVVLEELGCTDN